MSLEFNLWPMDMGGSPRCPAWADTINWPPSPVPTAAGWPLPCPRPHQLEPQCGPLPDINPVSYSVRLFCTLYLRPTSVPAPKRCSGRRSLSSQLSILASCCSWPVHSGTPSLASEATDVENDFGFGSKFLAVWVFTATPRPTSWDEVRPREGRCSGA